MAPVVRRVAICSVVLGGLGLVWVPTVGAARPCGAIAVPGQQQARVATAWVGCAEGKEVAATVYRDIAEGRHSTHHRVELFDARRAWPKPRSPAGVATNGCSLRPKPLTTPANGRFRAIRFDNIASSQHVWLRDTCEWRSGGMAASAPATPEGSSTTTGSKRIASAAR